MPISIGPSDIGTVGSGVGGVTSVVGGIGTIVGGVIDGVDVSVAGTVTLLGFTPKILPPVLEHS
jgi:hypothetical protein